MTTDRADPPRHGGDDALAALRAAYEATRYEVDVGARTAVIRVGHGAPAAVTAELARRGATSAAFLTAANPRSVRLPAPANVRRHAALRAALDALGVDTLPGRGRGTGGDWPPEESLLAIGIAPAAARRLAERFGQHAYVAVAAGAPARLVFTAHWPGPA